MNAVVYPVALNGPILTIRRFPDDPITMEKLIAFGSITEECAQFLKKLVQARYSIVIGGGTGSGKTTFLGAVTEYIPKDERLITIEDNAELKIRGIDNLVCLEAKMANMAGAVSVTIRDLIRSALRMRPDRIILGEVRGGEAVDMLQSQMCIRDRYMEGTTLRWIGFVVLFKSKRLWIQKSGISLEKSTSVTGASRTALSRSTAVSYTHIDVYKRQEPTCMESWFRPEPMPRDEEILTFVSGEG